MKHKTIYFEAAWSRYSVHVLEEETEPMETAQDYKGETLCCRDSEGQTLAPVTWGKWEMDL